jgi:hypothetical protein
MITHQSILLDPQLKLTRLNCILDANQGSLRHQQLDLNFNLMKTRGVYVGDTILQASGELHEMIMFNLTKCRIIGEQDIHSTELIYRAIPKAFNYTLSNPKTVKSVHINLFEIERRAETSTASDTWKVLLLIAIIISPLRKHLFRSRKILRILNCDTLPSYCTGSARKEAIKPAEVNSNYVNITPTIQPTGSYSELFVSRRRLIEQRILQSKARSEVALFKIKWARERGIQLTNKMISVYGTHSTSEDDSESGDSLDSDEIEYLLFHEDEPFEQNLPHYYGGQSWFIGRDAPDSYTTTNTVGELNQHGYSQPNDYYDGNEECKGGYQQDDTKHHLKSHLVTESKKFISKKNYVTKNSDINDEFFIFL